MITPANASAATSAANGPATKSEKSAAASASDFNNFLSLLTAQLRNQDPLSPLDSTQFVEQLASFSSVEQQIETNRLLEEMVSGAGNSDLGAATSWIGKEVEAETKTAHFSGDPLSFEIPARAGATPAEFVVRSASGSVIYHEALRAGQTTITWNGINSSGDAAFEGDYKVSVEYALEDGSAESGPLRTTARVTEARLVDGALSLLLANGALIDPATVSAVRAGDDQTS